MFSGGEFFGGSYSAITEKYHNNVVTILSGSEYVPSWVKNLVIWYGEGNISEGEFSNAIAFLVENGIILNS